MSDTERLLRAFASGSLVRPSPEAANVVDLARAVARLTGADEVPPSPNSEELAGLIGPTDHLVFVLADGLALSMMEHLPADSFLRSNLATKIATVFPSTTAVALTTFATGEWPATHAVTGWWTHLEEIGGAAAILPFVRRSDRRPLAQLGVGPERAFPISAMTPGTDWDSLALLPTAIAGSVYPTYSFGGNKTLGYKQLRDAFDTVISRARQSESPTYTYVYYDRVDVEAHKHGASHEGVRAALHWLDRELERLAEQVQGRGKIVVTADHGFLDAPSDARHRIAASDPLLDALRSSPSGDARVMYLHVKRGAEDRVRKLFRERFGERFFLISVDEAETLELFGPGRLSAPTRERIGDLVAISSGPDIIEYVAGSGTGHLASMASHHSGLTPQEMHIPLVVT